MDVLRRHSIATAHAARIVAARSSIPPDYAFLCGLLHDIGMAAALLVLDEMESVLRTPLPDRILASALGTLHPSLGAVVGRLWDLPPDVQLVLAHHHTVEIGGHLHPGASIVAVAEAIVQRLGHAVSFGEDRCDGTTGAVLLRARDNLGLD
jgi:putative nucleotidyltransferase with HDIG domain